MTRLCAACLGLCLVLITTTGCRDEPAERPDAAPPVVDAAPPPPDAAVVDAIADAAAADAAEPGDAQVVLGAVTVIKLDLSPAPGKKPVATTTTEAAPGTAPGQAPGQPPTAATPRQTSIMGTIQRHQDEVVDCYAQVAEKKPDIAGQLTVQWTLGADGTPTGAAIARDTLGDPAVGACVKSKAVKWKFPPPDGGLGVVKYTWNLKLQ